ncbi:MAG: thioredoxin domain-containing protein, partial [Proteobacteria bacterium]
EKDDVAEILNKHFVAIKVDREERPDVDGFYMKAVQAMKQRGGWPLSVMLTDEGKPFWGGTFFPREQFKGILNRIHEIWLTENHVLKDNAFELTEHLKLRDEELFEKKSAIDQRTIDAFIQSKVESFDAKLGGFGSAPKFPSSLALMLLLRYPEHRSMAFKTLNSMARGGMRDQVGGGFHRYSVDDQWLVPHFEKMLYDNALLTLAYTDAYAAGERKNREYERVITSTLDYVLRDMTHTEGGFYSAEDADSEKTEGKFYVWNKSEFEPEFLQRMEKYFEITAEGNFEVSKHVEELEVAAGLKAVQHANILHHMNAPQIPNDDEYKNLIAELFSRRAKRIRPGLDDKILAAWNGWMIGAFAKAGRVLENKKFILAAEKAMNFVLTKMLQKDTLLRCYR